MKRHHHSRSLVPLFLSAFLSLLVCYTGAFELAEIGTHPCNMLPRFSITQVVTKRCRLSWLTNSTLVCEPKCLGRGAAAGSQPMKIAVHRSPYKLWRFNSISNLWPLPMALLSVSNVRHKALIA